MTVSSVPHVATQWQSHQYHTLWLNDSLISTTRCGSMRLNGSLISTTHCDPMAVSSEPHLATQCQSNQSHTWRPYDSLIKTTHYYSISVSSVPHVATQWQSYQYHRLRPNDSLISIACCDSMAVSSVPHVTYPLPFSCITFCLKINQPAFFLLEAKIVGRADFSDQCRKIVIRYKRIDYNINIMQQSAYLLFNPITVNKFAILFICMSVGVASDSEMAST